MTNISITHYCANHRVCNTQKTMSLQVKYILPSSRVDFLKVTVPFTYTLNEYEKLEKIGPIILWVNLISPGKKWLNFHQHKRTEKVLLLKKVRPRAHLQIPGRCGGSRGHRTPSGPCRSSPAPHKASPSSRAPAGPRCCHRRSSSCQTPSSRPILPGWRDKTQYDTQTLMASLIIYILRYRCTTNTSYNSIDKKINIIAKY